MSAFLALSFVLTMGCDPGSVTVSGTVSCSQCGDIVVSALPGLDPEAEPVNEELLFEPGTYSMVVPAKMGSTMIRAFSDDNENWLLDPGEDSTRTIVEIEGEDLSGIDLRIGAPSGDCLYRELEGALPVRAIPWAEDQSFEPQLAGDDCSPIALWLSEDDDGYPLQVEMELDPTSEVILELRQRRARRVRSSARR